MLSQFGLTRVLPPSSLLLLRLRLSALLCSCRLGSDRGCVSVRRVVCCLVRTALSWSSPVDLASLAWLLSDEQSSYEVLALRMGGNWSGFGEFNGFPLAVDTQLFIRTLTVPW